MIMLECVIKMCSESKCRRNPILKYFGDPPVKRQTRCCDVCDDPICVMRTLKNLTEMQSRSNNVDTSMVDEYKFGLDYDNDASQDGSDGGQRVRRPRRSESPPLPAVPRFSKDVSLDKRLEVLQKLEEQQERQQKYCNKSNSFRNRCQ